MYFIILFASSSSFFIFAKTYILTHTHTHTEKMEKRNGNLDFQNVLELKNADGQTFQTSARVSRSPKEEKSLFIYFLIALVCAETKKTRSCVLKIK